MQVVAHASVGGAHVGIAEEHVLGRLVEAQLVKVLADGPFPENISLPVHFDHSVVQQLLVGNLGIADGLVHQD